MANQQDIDPSRISMMVVPVFERKTTSTREEAEFLYTAYILDYPGLSSVLISEKEADKKIKDWEAQGYGYSQCKWFLFMELRNEQTQSL